MRSIINIIWWGLLISIAVLDNIKAVGNLFKDRNLIIFILIMLLVCCHLANMYYDDKDEKK